MALDTDTSSRGAVTTAVAGASKLPRSSHWLVRGSLVALTALVAVTSIQGAIFVVPTMPPAWLHQGLVAPFSDYTLPALALGILCGGGALLAFVMVLRSPQIGGAVSVIAGILMVGFELVEIAVVGFTPVLYPTQPSAWLQVFYLVVGTAMAVLGRVLWRLKQHHDQAGLC